VQEEPTTGYLIWRVSMKWRAAVDRALSHLGLTQAQYSVLASLYGLSRQGTRPSQRQLADFTGLEAIYVSKLARALERGGLVERADNPADPRAVQLTLTDKGVDVVARAIATVHALQEELTAPLGGVRGSRNRQLVEALRTLLGEQETHMTQPAPPLTGMDINLAARATRAVFDTLLGKGGITFAEWVALRTLALQGPAIERDTLKDTLTSLLPGEAPAGELLDALRSRGLLGDDGDRIVLTADGEALFGRLQGEVGRTTAELYGDLDPEDLATTRRILAEVAQRANARLGS
jgi:DNA-binding MarR family transcriptional regulator